MSNELIAKAQGQGLMALMTTLSQSAAQLYEDTGTSSGAFFQFSGKNGDYSFNGQPLDVGTVLAFDMMLMSKGVICWYDNKPISRNVVRVVGGGPAPQAPPIDERERGHDWRNLVEVPVVLMETGEKAGLGLSSGGGVRALSRLFEDFAKKVKMYVDDNGEPMIPLVEIDSEKKNTKDDEGKTINYFIPKFKIVDWIAKADLYSVDASAEGDDVADESEVEEAPKPAAKPAAATRPTAGRPGVRR